MQNTYFRNRSRAGHFYVVAIAIFLAVAATLSWGCGRSVSAAPPVKKVLTIFPANSAYPYVQDFTISFKQRLQQETAYRAEFYHEYLELTNIETTDDLSRALAEVFTYKYKDNRPDIIVASTLIGINFLQKYCRDIFGDTPVIVFFSRPTDIPPELQAANYTFCYPAIEPAKNVELIQALKPSIQQLYVIMGESKDERMVRARLPQQLAPFSGRLAITYLNNLTLPELLERTRAIEGPAAILYVDYGADATGKKVIPAQVIRTIAAKAKVPVFGSYSTHIGEGGGVGGYVVNMSALGREVGERATAILAGATMPDRIDSVNISEYRFDWNELTRWGIAEDKLPPGSMILNKPLSLWETYRWHIIGLTFSVAFLVMVLEAGAIVLYRRNKRKNEADLLRLDRLNLVGEMAASIGHEVRNPMTTVRGYLQMFLRKDDYAQHRQQFATMVEEIDRANDIISGFLSLAKNKAVEMKRDNLNNVINALSPMLQAEAMRTGHDLQVEMGKVPDVTLDEKEIRQILLNLAYNAFDAMEAGGKLTIATYLENGNVVLAVSDTGKGIPREVMDKLGTPFLTTKKHGTGLGLPVCYRIAERHGAKIDVRTSPQGTTFSIYFKISKG